MPEVKKKCVKIVYEDKVIAVLPVCELTPAEYVVEKEEAKKNLNEILKKRKEKNQKRENQINKLIKDVALLLGEEENEEGVE